MPSDFSRREFFVLGAAAALASRVRGAEAATAFPNEAVAANDSAVARSLDAQVLVAGHPFRGGIPDASELYHAGEAGRFIQQATAAYFCDASRYFGDDTVMERVEQALSFLEAAQSSDGNVDLLSTNFNSPPDTGFVVHAVASAANIARMNVADALAPLFKPFLAAAGRGMAKGGIHTPNHRWVVSAALAQIHELYPDDSLVDRIDAWLAEGIDIDEEGQFTERSTGGYNAVCDDAFVVLAHKLGRPALLDAVRKNLDATAYLLHPNGEVVTEASNRQDRNTTATMGRYWFALRYMAIRDGNGLYASMLKPIEPQSMDLPLLMEYPELNAPLPSATPLPDDFILDLPRSGITRVRRGKLSATVIHRGDSRWVSVHSGDAVINAIRFASAFFGKGQFRPTQFERVGDEFRFGQTLEGRYYQPLADPEQLPVSQEQFGVKRGRRDVSEVCTMHYEGRVRETTNGLALLIQATGTKGVPLAVEINLRAGMEVSGADPLGNERYLLRDGMARCTLGSDTILVGPGLAAHRYIEIRGAEGALRGPSLYLTAYTPFEMTLEIQSA